MIGDSLSDDSELTESSTAYHNLLEHSRKLEKQAAHFSVLASERHDRILDLERQVAELSGHAANAERERDKARTDAAGLEALFALQRTRMDRATKLWQNQTGKSDVLPDLGDLLDWLMAKAETQESNFRCRLAEGRALLEDAARRLNSLLYLCVGDEDRALRRIKEFLESPVNSSADKWQVREEALKKIARMICWQLVISRPLKPDCDCFSCTARAALGPQGGAR